LTSAKQRARLVELENIMAGPTFWERSETKPASQWTRPTAFAAGSIHWWKLDKRISDTEVLIETWRD